jgi:hypothetical protein
MGEFKYNSEFVDGNKWPSLWHYTNISVQSMLEKQNILSTTFEIMKHSREFRHSKTEIQTTKSANSADDCLTVVISNLLHISPNTLEK